MTLRGVTYSMSVTSEVRGQLQGLRKSIQTTITRQALNRAVEPLRLAAKSLYPEGTGPAVRADGSPRPRLKDTIAKRLRRYQKGDGYYAVIGPRGRSDGRKGSEAPHAHLVERGTVRRFRQIINGKYSWVMFAPSWNTLSLQAQRSSHPKISSMRPHIAYSLPGVYEKYLNARWRALSEGSRTEKRSTEKMPEARVMPRAWSQSSSQVESIFVQVFAEKVMQKSALSGSASPDASLAE